MDTLTPGLPAPSPCPQSQVLSILNISFMVLLLHVPFSALFQVTTRMACNNESPSTLSPSFNWSLPI